MKTRFLRMGALLLACIFLLLTSSCTTGTGKPLLTLEKDGISVSISKNVYELMLSRMKGSLVFYGYKSPSGATPAEKEFWEYYDKFNKTDLQTADEFYKDAVLDSCRTYLISLYLFEKEGLSLSAAKMEEIEKNLDELIRTDGNGSKTKLNALLSVYGANYNILRETYLIEAKAEAVREHLYGKNGSKLGKNIKDEYLNENYVHFRQILFTTYEYVYETDQNGDTIYYYADGDNKGHVYYDVHNGEIGYDDKGNEIKDKKGDTVWFVKGTDYEKIAYNKTYGEPIPVLDEDGIRYKMKTLTEEEIAKKKAQAQTLFEELKGTSQSVFEAVMEEESDDLAQVGEYEDGYYLQTNLDYAAQGKDYEYLAQIVEALEKAAVGELVLVESSFGFHIVRKYAHTASAYDKEENTDWFATFYSGLIEKLFIAECDKYLADIQVIEKVLADTPSMKDVGINYYY